MKDFKRQLQTFFISLGLVSSAISQASTIATDADKGDKGGKKAKLSLRFSSSLVTNLYEDSSDRKNIMNHNNLRATVTTPKKLAVTMGFALSKSLKNRRQMNIGNASVGFSGLSKKLNKELTWSGSTGFAIPTSRTARNNQDLITTVRLTSALSYKPATMKNLSLSHSFPF